MLDELDMARLDVCFSTSGRHTITAEVTTNGSTVGQAKTWLECSNKSKVPDAINIGLSKDAKRIEYFSNEDEAINFLRRAIALGYRVEVHVNVVPVMNDFAKASSWCVHLSKEWDAGTTF